MTLPPLELHCTYVSVNFLIFQVFLLVALTLSICERYTTPVGQNLGHTQGSMHATAPGACTRMEAATARGQQRIAHLKPRVRQNSPSSFLYIYTHHTSRLRQLYILPNLHRCHEVHRFCRPCHLRPWSCRRLAARGPRRLLLPQGQPQPQVQAGASDCLRPPQGRQ